MKRYKLRLEFHPPVREDEYLGGFTITLSTDDAQDKEIKQWEFCVECLDAELERAFREIAGLVKYHTHEDIWHYFGIIKTEKANGITKAVIHGFFPKENEDAE